MIKLFIIETCVIETFIFDECYFYSVIGGLLNRGGKFRGRGNSP